MTARPASTLLLLRSVDAPVEVLMIKRSPDLFFGGWWVFPGGSVEPIDREKANLALLDGVDDPDEGAWMLAALRETAEEVGLFLTKPLLAKPRRNDVFRSIREAGALFDGSAVAYLSNWVPPDIVPKRFDTRFFVAEWPSDQQPVPDGVEVSECEWVVPREMLSRDHHEYRLVLPTIKHLELLSTFASPAQAMAHAQSVDVITIKPRPVKVGDVLEMLLPGEDGYDEAGP